MYWLSALFVLLLVVAASAPGSPPASQASTLQPVVARQPDLASLHPRAVIAFDPPPQARPMSLNPPVLSSCDPLVETRDAPYPPNLKQQIVYSELRQPENLQGFARSYYLDGQVLMTGTPEAIRLTVDAANRILGPRDVPLTLVPDPIATLPQSERGQQATLLAVFKPNSGVSVADVVNTLRAVQAPLTQRIGDKDVATPLVLADPNYILAPTQPAACAVEGSPLHGEGSPLHGEGSPLGGANTPFSSVQIGDLPDYFWDQWALSGVAPGSINVARKHERRGDIPTGKGSQVIMLDTSPFDQPGRYVFKGVGWMTPNLEVCVEHPIAKPQALDPPASCTATPADQSDHGVFVAGLAHAVAPDASLRLVRVLDEHGQGDLGTTLYVLSQLANRPLSNTVLNLSLGFHPITPTVSLTRQQVCPLIGLPESCTLASIFLAFPQLSPAERGLVEQVLDGATLEAYLEPLLNRNVVVVAASGNDSDVNSLHAPQVPASFAPFHPTLVPAGGSDYRRARAYFADDALNGLSAPAGGYDRTNCDPSHHGGNADYCWDLPEYYLVSVATQRDASNNVTWGYGGWAGTSFATPLVSGMEALSFAEVRPRGAALAPSAGDVVTQTASMTCAPPASPATSQGLGMGIVGFCP